MRWFHDLRALAKLLGTFALLCVVMAVIGYFGLSTAQGIKANLDNATSNLLPSSIALANQNNALDVVKLNVRSAIISTDQTESNQFVKLATDAFPEIEKQEAIFKALPVDPADAVSFADYDKVYPQWKVLLQDALKNAALNTDASNAAAADTILHQAAPLATQLTKDMNDLLASQVRQGNDASAQAQAGYDSASRVLVGTLTVAVLASMGIGFYVARSIAEPLSITQEFAVRVAVGDVNYDIGDARRKIIFAAAKRKDEVGKLTAVFMDLKAYMLGMAESAQRLAQDDLTVEVVPQSSEDVLGVAFQGMVLNLRELVGQVQSAAISLADTSAQMSSAAAQTGAAVQQVTMAVQNVATGAQETSRSAQETTTAVSQLSQVIDGIARGATDQARQVQTTSATAAQMATGVEGVATNASQMATAGKQTEIVAQRGGQAVRETTAAMNEIQVVVGDAASKVRELGVLSQKIGAVVETIDDIAEQTNLLALNAAIEAARAGEQGKGFAIVADEVRKLAARSGRETKSIADLIAQVQTGTKDAVAAMDTGAAKVELGSEKAGQAGQALDEILKAVQDTVRQVGEIASSTQQMAGGARSVTDAMHSISAVVEESSAATEQMAAQASAVTGSIQSIAAVSEQQSAATEEVSASTEQMSAQVEQMSAQAQELASTAAQLRSLTSRFQLDANQASSDPVTRQLDLALVAHAEWKVRLERALESGSVDMTPEAARHDNRCVFGKWLYEEADATLQRSEEYERVRVLHASFHVVAADVLRLVLSGQLTEVRQALASGGGFARASSELTMALLHWQQMRSNVERGAVIPRTGAKVIPLRRVA